MKWIIHACVDGAVQYGLVPFGCTHSQVGLTTHTHTTHPSCAMKARENNSATRGEVLFKMFSHYLIPNAITLNLVFLNSP